MKDKKILTEEDIQKFRDISEWFDFTGYDSEFIGMLESLIVKKMSVYEWRPFETAPKDREIIVCYPRQMNVTELVRFDRIHGYWRSKGEPMLGIELQGCLWTEIPEIPTF